MPGRVVSQEARPEKLTRRCFGNVLLHRLADLPLIAHNTASWTIKAAMPVCAWRPTQLAAVIHDVPVTSQVVLCPCTAFDNAVQQALRWRIQLLAQSPHSREQRRLFEVVCGELLPGPLPPPHVSGLTQEGLELAHRDVLPEVPATMRAELVSRDEGPSQPAA